MRSQLHSWWKKIKEHPISFIVIFIATIIGIALIVVIILGYYFDWDWTGLGPYTTPNSNFQRGKTLWDWMQLLVIPAVLAIAGYTFTLTTSQNERRATEQRSKDEQKAAEQRSQTERDIALDNQRETALQDYIDTMSQFLLDKGLLISDPDSKVQAVARVRTLTVLRRLDGNRKGAVLRFLQEAGILSIISTDASNELSRPDFSSANLREVYFVGINLFGVNLRGADLAEANLCNANLIESDLEEANLREAKLDRADLGFAKLNRADLTHANFSNANLENADLSYTNLSNANLSNAKLSGANLENADLSNANLMDALQLHL